MPPRRRSRSVSALGRLTTRRLVLLGQRHRVAVNKPLLNVRAEKKYFTVGEEKDVSGKPTGEFKEKMSHSKKVLQKVSGRAEQAAANLLQAAFAKYRNRKMTQRELQNIVVGVSEKRASLQSKSASQLNRLNQRDMIITSLYNKEHFLNTVIPEFFSKHKRAALVIMDIDHFKDINTAVGHFKGDMAIRLFGRCVREAAHLLHGFGGRLGGDEMVVVLPNGARDARVFAARLNNILLNRFRDKAYAFLKGRKFTFSGGVALAGERLTIEEIKELADERAYISKNLGRNRITLPGRRLQTIRVRK